MAGIRLKDIHKTYLVDGRTFPVLNGVDLEIPEGKITVGGSSSVSPLMEKLIEAFKTVNPNAELELQTTDSTTGVSGALEGTYTIGMASRELKDSEVEGGAKATVLALDGIAVVVNPSNTTDDLTVDQIKGIYTGELTVWSDLQ